MKKIKLICFALLAVVGLAFAGESFILYLTTFEDQCIYADFYYNAEPDGTKEGMVDDIIKSAEKNDVEIFTVIDEGESTLKTTRKIYASSGVKKYVNDNFYVEAKEYNSIFSGNYAVEFYSFDKLIENGEDLGKGLPVYVIGDMDSAHAFKIDLTGYAGKFPQEPSKSSYNLYIAAVWGIIAVVTLLLTYFEIQFRKKECCVCVTLGTGISKVLLKSLLPDVIAFTAVFFIEYAVMRRFTNVDFMFNIALAALIILILLDIALYVIGLSSFNVKKAFSGLALTDKHLNVTYGLKLVTMVITLCIISGNITQVDSVMKYYELHDFFDAYSDYYFVNFLYDYDSENPDKIYDYRDVEIDFDTVKINSEFYLRMNEDSRAIWLSEHTDYDDSDRGYMIVNAGAYEYFSGKIAELKALDMSKDFYVLVPESMDSEKSDELIDTAVFDMNCSYTYEGEIIEIGRSYDVVYYSEDVNICAIRKYDDEMKFCSNRKSPVIVYVNDYDSAEEIINGINAEEYSGTFVAREYLGINMPELILRDNADTIFKVTQEELEEFASAHSDTHKLRYEMINAKEKYDYCKQAYDKLLILNLAASLLAIALQVIISITIIRAEYSINSKELFIKKTMGYSVFQNNKRMILYSLIPLSLFVVVSLVLFFIMKMDMLIYYALVGLLLLVAEMLFIVLFTLRMERISIHNMIKGGVL